MKVRNLILAALFAAMTAASAFFPQIPMVPVPITFQLLFCIMAGMLLGPSLGALSQLIYIIIGLLGLPVFAAGGGIAYILKPSFGYLLGFVAGAFVCGFIIKRVNELTFIKALFAALAGVAVVYLIGAPYLYFMVNMNTPNAMSIGKTLTAGLLVFLPGDVLKCLAAALVTVLVRPVLIKQKII